jgi:hypothetical protein
MDKAAYLAKLIEVALYNGRRTVAADRGLVQRAWSFQRFAGEDDVEDIIVPNARAFIAELQNRTTRNWQPFLQEQARSSGHGRTSRTAESAPQVCDPGRGRALRVVKRALRPGQAMAPTITATARPG